MKEKSKKTYEAKLEEKIYEAIEFIWASMDGFIDEDNWNYFEEVLQEALDRLLVDVDIVKDTQ